MGETFATEPTLPTTRPLRIALFAGVCVVAVIVAFLGLRTAHDERNRTIAAAEPIPAVDAPEKAAIDDGPLLLFRSTALGDSYGRVAWVPAGQPDGIRTISELECERVDFRDGTGVCLRANRGFYTTYDALVFDDTLTVSHKIGLAGAPSRVRISPGGTMAGMTVFVTGHSYAEGGFSTQTTLVDLTDGNVVADLETDFKVYRNGEVWHEIDFNFWGVTFIDDASFYATLGTGGKTYLVRGDINAREFEILRQGVECPSLSPDGTRLAFKIVTSSGIDTRTWGIAVLDLATSEVLVVAEQQNVDDQVAWLDNETIMYGLPDPESGAGTNTWIVPANGAGSPQLLLSAAWSANQVL